MAEGRNLRADALTKQIRELNENVGNLAGDVVASVAKVDAYGRRNRLMAWVAVIGVTLDIVLTIGGAVLLGKYHTVQHRLERTQTQLAQVQKTLRDQVICPVYGLVLSAGYHPERHGTGPVLAQYIAGYTTIYKAYAAAGCPGAAVLAPSTKPPGSSPSPAPSEVPRKTK